MMDGGPEEGGVTTRWFLIVDRKSKVASYGSRLQSVWLHPRNIYSIQSLVSNPPDDSLARPACGRSTVAELYQLRFGPNDFTCRVRPFDNRRFAAFRHTVGAFCCFFSGFPFIRLYVSHFFFQLICTTISLIY
jgi:hypothetical protein